MVDRDAIKDAVCENPEIRDMNGLYFAIASYEGREEIATGRSRCEAVGSLIELFYQREKMEEQPSSCFERVKACLGFG